MQPPSPAQLTMILAGLESVKLLEFWRQQTRYGSERHRENSCRFAERQSLYRETKEAPSLLEAHWTLLLSSRPSPCVLLNRKGKGNTLLLPSLDSGYEFVSVREAIG